MGRPSGGPHLSRPKATLANLWSYLAKLQSGSFLQLSDSLMTPGCVELFKVRDVDTSTQSVQSFRRSLNPAERGRRGAAGLREFADWRYFERGKRLLDIAISIALLLTFWPLIAAIALLICVEAGGPVLYLSRRIGRNGIPFTMYKFRTMVVDADHLKCSLLTRNERGAILFKISNDPRVTRLGRILRKYSLDELPQLINVLCGEMSLVGPRPPLASEVEQYAPHHFIRLTVPPGLTGLWQIQARRRPAFHDYVALDAEYVQNGSLWLDVKILWCTVGVVLGGRGI